jgi:hypothetical protein
MKADIRACSVPALSVGSVRSSGRTEGTPGWPKQPLLISLVGGTPSYPSANVYCTVHVCVHRLARLVDVQTTLYTIVIWVRRTRTGRGRHEPVAGS